MKPRIYAYYQPILPGDQKIEFALANLWKQSFEAHGWQAVMLNRSHAGNSGLSAGVKLIGRPQTDVARDLALCALHAAGGGWLSHYDVINRGFTPCCAESTQQQDAVLEQYGIRTHGISFYLGKTEIEAALAETPFLWHSKIITDNPDDFDKYPLAHCSSAAAAKTAASRLDLAKKAIFG